MTAQLADLLHKLDIRLLDHFVVAGDRFAQCSDYVKEYAREAAERMPEEVKGLLRGLAKSATVELPPELAAALGEKTETLN